MTGTAPHKDGRNARSARTKAALLDACRELLRNGTLRPHAAEIARVSGYSVRSVFQHFADVDSLYAEALSDALTLGIVIANLQRLTAQELATVAVLGRLGYYYGTDGKVCPHPETFPAIDLAALAQPARAQAGVAELVALAKAIGRHCAITTGPDTGLMNIKLHFLNQADKEAALRALYDLKILGADALAALNGGE